MTPGVSRNPGYRVPRASGALSAAEKRIPSLSSAANPPRQRPGWGLLVRDRVFTSDTTDG